MKTRKKVIIFTLFGLALGFLQPADAVDIGNRSERSKLIDKDIESTEIVEGYYIPVDKIKHPETLQTSSLTSDDLQATEVTEISFRNGLTSKTTYEYDFKNGAMGHTLKYRVNSIKKVNGYYSNALNHFYTKAVLESKAVTVEKSYHYTRTVTNTLSYSESVEMRVNEAFSTKLSLGDKNGELAVKTGSSFAYSNTATYSQTVASYYDETLRLDKNSAKYCPSGYSMSIGLFGVYYVYDLTCNEYTNWWWGQSLTSGTVENRRVIAVESDEGQMTVGFVYKKGENNYYLP